MLKTTISRRHLLSAALAGAGAAALAACSSQREPESKLPSIPDRPSTPPNIVLLFSDEHRHDAMGCAGNTTVQTPNLDRLASQGTRFTRTYCQGPLCQPSRASLITGRYVHEHGILTTPRPTTPTGPPS